MSVPASVLNEIFVDKINHEGSNSVVPLLTNFINNYLVEEYGENQVEVESVDLDKVANVITLSVHGRRPDWGNPPPKKSFICFKSWTEQQLLAAEQSLTDLIIDALEEAFEMPTDGNTIS